MATANEARAKDRVAALVPEALRRKCEGEMGRYWGDIGRFGAPSRVRRRYWEIWGDIGGFGAPSRVRGSSQPPGAAGGWSSSRAPEEGDAWGRQEEGGECGGAGEADLAHEGGVLGEQVEHVPVGEPDHQRCTSHLSQPHEVASGAAGGRRAASAPPAARPPPGRNRKGCLRVSES